MMMIITIIIIITALVIHRIYAQLENSCHGFNFSNSGALKIKNAG